MLYSTTICMMIQIAAVPFTNISQPGLLESGSKVCGYLSSFKVDSLK